MGTLLSALIGIIVLYLENFLSLEEDPSTNTKIFQSYPKYYLKITMNIYENNHACLKHAMYIVRQELMMSCL